MKIRTDFVTNSSSSSFTLIIALGLKNGKSIRFKAESGVGEYGEPYYQLVATKGPRELGECTTIDELVEMIKESVGCDGIEGQGPELETNRILKDSSKFIKQIRQVPSIDEIGTVEVTGKLDGRYDHWYRTFIYDRYTATTSFLEDGKSFLSEGEGGALYFSEVYEMEHKRLEQERMEARAKDPKWITVKRLIEDERNIDDTFAFSGKHFVTTGASDEDELQKEIEKRGGIFHGNMVKSVDYLVINILSAGENKVKQALDMLNNGAYIKLISEDQLRQAISNPKYPAMSEEEYDRFKEESKRKKELIKVTREKERQMAEEARHQREEARRQRIEEKERMAEEVRQRRDAERRVREEAKQQEEAEKQRMRAEKTQAKAEKERLAAEAKAQKEQARREATANAVILYAPGEEPEKLSKRLNTLFEKLDGAYPDKKISRLNQDHKKWGETVTELYRLLGYPDSQSFLEAYGYTVEKNAGGRPASVDPVAIMAELHRRYPNGGAESMDALKRDNPDIPWKTLANNAKEYFGNTLVRHLKLEGIL